MAIIESDVKVQGTGTGGPVDTVKFTKTVIVDGNPVIVEVDREGVWQGSKDSANPAYQEYEPYLAGRVVLWGPNNEPLLKTLDYDTGAGTDNRPAVGVLLPKSGGAVAGGTSTDPLRVDPTGSTAQPITGSVTANQGTPGGSAWPVDGSGVTQPVSGAVTANAGTNLNTSALALEAGGNLAAILAKLLGSLAVTGTFWQAKQPVSEGDGDNAALGTTSDLATASTGIGLLKAIKTAVQGTLTATISGSVAVTGTFWQAVQPVSGTFWQATQPVSVSSLPLPTGAAQDGTDATGVAAPTGATGIRGWLSGIFNKLNTSIAVTGTFWQATQPVSGTVTANAGTNLNTSSLALETGGNLASSKADLDTLAGAVASANFQTRRTDISTSGNLTTTSGGGSVISVATNGMGTVRFHISGTYAGIELEFDGSMDGGTTWLNNLPFLLDSNSWNAAGSFYSPSNNTTHDISVPCSGFSNIRAVCVTRTSGTMAVLANAGAGIASMPAVDYRGMPFQTNPGNAQDATDVLAVVQMMSNGSTLDMVPSLNRKHTVIPSGAYTSNQAGSFTNYGYNGLLIKLAVTVISGSAPSLTLEVDDPDLQGRIFLAAAAQTTVANFYYLLFPGATAATPGGLNMTEIANRTIVGTTVNIAVAHGNANSVTYSVSAWPARYGS